MANPPAPDVEAIARRTAASWGQPSAAEMIASALTAHTASLREKVEELERELASAHAAKEVAGFQSSLAECISWLSSDAYTERAEANRLREELASLCDEIEATEEHGADAFEEECPICRSLGRARAALSPRPADEPVTLGER